MECSECGMKLGSLQVHPEHQCQEQQAINRRNRGDICPFCSGIGNNHKDGCPRKVKP